MRVKQPFMKRIRSLFAFRGLRQLRTRRTHKSLKLTRRRDLPRPAALPGLIAFTSEVFRKVWAYRKTFSFVLLFYIVVAFLLIGVSQQDDYRSLTDALADVAKEAGTNGLDTVTQVGGLFGATLLGSLNGSFSELQQFYLIGLYALMWLLMVWLLRQLVAGNAVKLRDGIYNAGAPLISSACIILLMFVQALPGSLGILLFSITTQNNSLLSGGVAAMCFGVLALLLVVLSLYWMTSSFFALLIVTLPGTYPMQAIRGASEIALGRRSQLLLRLLWLFLVLIIIWAIILVPAILIDLWVKVSWLPIVTLGIQTATGLSFIVGVTYIFLLYRRMIDDPAQ